jgi:hypothetical protein
MQKKLDKELILKSIKKNERSEDLKIFLYQKQRKTKKLKWQSQKL